MVPGESPRTGLFVPPMKHRDRPALSIPMSVTLTFVLELALGFLADIVAGLIMLLVRELLTGGFWRKMSRPTVAP